MEDKEFIKIIHLLGWSKHEDDNVMKELLMYYQVENLEPLMNPFNKELNRNLLNKESLEGKKSFLKHYLYELLDLSNVFIKYDRDLFNLYEIGGLDENFNRKGKLSESNKYMDISYIVYDKILNEIQNCCNKYGFNFFELCKELNFSIEKFDSRTFSIFQQQTVEYRI